MFLAFCLPRFTLDRHTWVCLFTHTHIRTSIQTVRKEPRDKIATLEFLEENHSAWSQYMSYFRVGQRRMWAGEICRREQSVTREIRLAKVLLTKLLPGSTSSTQEIE